MLKILSTVVFATIVTWTVFSFLPAERNPLSLNLIVMDFYFLLSLVMGARVSFHVLNYLSRRDQCDGKKKVLIYGAGSESLLTVQKILSDESLGYCPIGFLDDDPKLEGKRLNGYPIFGGHLKLEGILRKTKVVEIIVSTDALKPKVLERLRQIARAHGVLLRRTELRIEELRAPAPRPPVQKETEHLVLIEK